MAAADPAQEDNETTADVEEVQRAAAAEGASVAVSADLRQHSPLGGRVEQPEATVYGVTVTNRRILVAFCVIVLAVAIASLVLSNLVKNAFALPLVPPPLLPSSPPPLPPPPPSPPPPSPSPRPPSPQQPPPCVPAPSSPPAPPPPSTPLPPASPGANVDSASATADLLNDRFVHFTAVGMSPGFSSHSGVFMHLIDGYEEGRCAHRARAHMIMHMHVRAPCTCTRADALLPACQSCLTTASMVPCVPA